jgi:hypothetical protein
VATVPPERVDFAGDETGIGGGGISSEAVPAFARVVAAIDFEPFLAREPGFGGIALRI